MHQGPFPVFVSVLDAKVHFSTTCLWVKVIKKTLVFLNLLIRDIHTSTLSFNNWINIITYYNYHTNSTLHNEQIS